MTTDTIILNIKNCSKGIFTVFIMSVFIMVGSIDGQAQNYIDVEPDVGYPLEIGNLNEAIENEGADDVVFRLQRGGVYWLDSRIRREHYLTIVAEEGDGPRPMIRAAVDGTGDDIGRWLDADGSGVTLQSIYLSGLDEEGNRVGQMQVRQVEGANVTIDDTYYEYEDQSLIRHNVNGVSYFITNSKFRNVGRESDPDNGRIIDTRGNVTDSLVLRNNTMYGYTHNMFLTFGNVINYLEMDHNTIVDGGMHFTTQMVKEAKITNNLISSVGWRGNNASLESGMDDQAIFIFVSAPDSIFSDAERNIVISNNNVGSMHADYINLLEENWEPGEPTNPKGEPTDRLFMHDMIIDSTGLELEEQGVLVMENNINEVDGPGGTLEFVERSPMDAILSYYEAYLTNPDGDLPFFYDRDLDNDIIGEDTWPNFAYNQDAESFTHAERGFPLGNLNYWPEEYMTAWLAGDDAPGSTNIDHEDVRPKQFRLVGAYPNPFNPTTQIAYELASSAEVDVTVYNMLGAKVKTIDAGIRPAGSHTVNLEASNMASGVYMVRMQVGNEIQGMKVTLLK